MLRELLSRLRRRTPKSVKTLLRKAGLTSLIDACVWSLPSPAGYFKMGGPGVFGTYVAYPYEPEVVNILVNLVRRGWICADVGAHLGYYTLLLAKLTGAEGKVFSFEALPENAYWLKRNVHLNALDERVVVENLAVAEETGVRELRAPEHYTNEWSLVRGAPHGQSVSVSVTTLDTYFAQGPRLHFIKLDVEGAECLVLQGARSVLKRDRPLLLLELHGEEGRSSVLMLEELDYQCFSLEGERLSTSSLPRYVLARTQEQV